MDSCAHTAMALAQVPISYFLVSSYEDGVAQDVVEKSATKNKYRSFVFGNELNGAFNGHIYQGRMIGSRPTLLAEGHHWHLTPFGSDRGVAVERARAMRTRGCGGLSGGVRPAEGAAATTTATADATAEEAGEVLSTSTADASAEVTGDAVEIVTRDKGKKRKHNRRNAAAKGCFTAVSRLSQIIGSSNKATPNPVSDATSLCLLWTLDKGQSSSLLKATWELATHDAPRGARIWAQVGACKDAPFYCGQPWPGLIANLVQPSLAVAIGHGSMEDDCATVCLYDDCGVACFEPVDAFVHRWELSIAAATHGGSANLLAILCCHSASSDYDAGLNGRLLLLDGSYNEIATSSLAEFLIRYTHNQNKSAVSLETLASEINFSFRTFFRF